MQRVHVQLTQRNPLCGKFAGRVGRSVQHRSQYGGVPLDAVCMIPQTRAHRSPTACKLWPFDLAWNPNLSAQSLAPQLFACSLFPYLGFLYHLTKSGQTPRLTLAGFYFLLAFVGATIPAGIYAKVHYGTSLANVDWLHGSAESLLTITNLLIVLGLRQGIAAALKRGEQAKALPLEMHQNASITAAREHNDCG